MSNTKINHHHVLTFLLGFMVLAMPNLNLLMSIGTILLLGFWFYKPGFKTGVKRLRENKMALALVGLFGIHVLWLWNTTNFDYAMVDLRVKLPMLAFGLILGSIPITRNQLKIIFLSLSLGIWFASIQAYINYADFVNGLHDHREIVQGISHIRLSLMMVLLVSAVIYFWMELGPWWKVYSLACVINVLMFFNILQSLTGVITLGAMLAFTVVYKLICARKFVLLGVFGLLSILITAAISWGSWNYYERHFTVANAEIDTSELTQSGNLYNHYTEIGIVENGHYIYTYISEFEMAEAWNSRSDLKIDYGKEENMNLAATLIRYLSSKGLRKDREGVLALSDTDVRNIEIGFPSVVYAEKKGLALRMHAFLFSVHIYNESGNASGLSFFQRVIYWNVATEVIKSNLWMGTGTGDIREAFDDMYQQLDPNLDKRFRLRSHNQFLSFFAAFGILGFLYFVWVFAIGFKSRKADYLAMAFLVIAILSCLVEDTVETQAGVTFFAFFYALFSKPTTPETVIEPQTSQS